MAIKKPIPSINVPIQSEDGSINWAWYLYLQWLASGAGGDATTVSVKVNSTTTGEPGTNAEVTNVGDDINVRLNFKIPRGAKGDTGDTGPQGSAATISVGTTTTLPAGSQATVTNVGTASAAVFDFGIPKGADGQGSVVDVKVDGTSVVTNNVANIDLSGKQNTISDLAAIRSGATLGATALQPTDVVNNVTSTATNKPLSANMGKVLQDQINNHQTIGKFLSFWDCTTGLPLTNPQTSPYTYHTGDYYRIKTVASAGGTNYRPSGSSYTTGVASTTVETEIVTEGQVYYYDGTSWGLAGGGAVTVDNSTVSYNDNSELQTIGVINNNDNSTAIKTWTGTLAEYNAITTKDADTLYNITDDISGGTSVYTKTEVDGLISGVFAALYPVGSLYIGTQSTNPMATLIPGSSWSLVATNRALWGGDGTNANTTIEAGLPNISGGVGGTKDQGPDGAFYSDEVFFAGHTSSGVDQFRRVYFSASRSSSIYGNSSTVQPPAYRVNVWRRTA